MPVVVSSWVQQITPMVGASTIFLPSRGTLLCAVPNIICPHFRIAFKFSLLVISLLVAYGCSSRVDCVSVNKKKWECV